MYQASFGHTEMAGIFDEEAVQSSRLQVEVALAEAEAELDLIPRSAAEEIAERARIEIVGLDTIAKHFHETDNDIVALTRALGERLSSEAREWVHYGATSQDIHITGLALLLQEAMRWFEDRLRAVEVALCDLAEAERDTLMAGRTHGQLATPITYGQKVSGWAYNVREHRQRLQQLKPRLLVGSMKGAVGTHAAFGAKGPEVEKRVMETLDLFVAPVNIQPTEARYVELLNWLSLVSVTVARIAPEIRGLHRSEVAELYEPFETGRQVGSSTMPHKRNPEWAETAQGVAYVVQSHAVGMTRVLQEHERDATRNGPEHLLISETCVLTANLLDGLHRTLRGLEIDRDKMRQNLNLMQGLIASEAVMFRLADATGKKKTAHNVVYECAHRAFKEQRPFRDVLAEEPLIIEHLGEEELDAALDPAQHLGSAPAQVDEVLRRLRKNDHNLDSQ
jgi:adenylosuccinate lyase